MQVAMMTDFMAVLENRLDGTRVALNFYYPSPKSSDTRCVAREVSIPGFKGSDSGTPMRNPQVCIQAIEGVQNSRVIHPET
jgi:hypothetical protein